MTELDQRIEILVDAIRRDSKPVNNWFELGGIMMSHLAWDALFNLFSDRESLHQDGLKLYSDLLMSHEAALSPHILSIYMNYECDEINSGYEAFLLYMSAACKISLGHMEEGREVFSRLANMVANDLALGEGLPHLYGLEKLQKQLFTSAEISKILTTNDVINLSEIQFVESGSEVKGDIILYAACDQVYFDKFSAQFIDVFNQFGHIHIHVVNGDVEQINQRLNNINVSGVSFSIEEYVEGIGSPYYACARFLQSNAVMNHFDKDLIILDIDVEGEANFSSYINESDSADVMLFRDITLVPWLKHRAAAIYVKNNQNGQQYLKSFTLMLIEALKEPAWFIDQSVLHCINQYWDGANMPVSIKYLEEKDRYILDDMIKSSGDLMEKRQMRTNTGFVK